MTGTCSSRIISSTASVSSPAFGWNTVRTQSGAGEEVREVLSDEVETGRLVIVADNLFMLDDNRFQEVVLYFLIRFTPDSKILDRDGVFEGNAPGTMFQGIPLDEVEQANLLPAFLRERVRGRFLILPNIS